MVSRISAVTMISKAHELLKLILFFGEAANLIWFAGHGSKVHFRLTTVFAAISRRRH